jgi:hypothetical protein
LERSSGETAVSCCFGAEAHTARERGRHPEASEFAWFAEDELPEPLFLPLRNLLERRVLR